MLRLDFYESGIGDTIIITFPDGGIGIVDAFPGNANRLPITELVRGRRIHFVCLTHPHMDHGLDLVPVVSDFPVESFWHTIPEMGFFFMGVEKEDVFPGGMREYASEIRSSYANCFIDLISAVEDRQIPKHLLRSDVQPRIFAGVDVHCISPEEEVQQKFSAVYRRRLVETGVREPEPNQISAILVLKYGKTAVLLGADALKANWQSAGKRYADLGLPKARLLKVPHHGASNAIKLGPSDKNSYLELCDRINGVTAVLFAGDSKHPDQRVFDLLRKKTNLMCLSNGYVNRQVTNPLNIDIPGAWSPGGVNICNSQIAFSLTEDGAIEILAGRQCMACAA